MNSAIDQWFSTFLQSRTNIWFAKYDYRVRTPVICARGRESNQQNLSKSGLEKIDDLFFCIWFQRHWSSNRCSAIMSRFSQGFMEKRPLLAPKQPIVYRPLLASFLASVMSFAGGTVVAGWTPPNKPSFVGEMLFMPATIEEQSWIVSIYVIGALVGALFAGRVSQAIGLKRLLLGLAVPMTVGWIIIACFVDHVYLIYVGRLLCGLSLGAVTVAVPLYNYDVAPDLCRGRGGVFLDFMLCAGILYSYVASSVMGLRMFSFTCSLIPVAFFVVFCFMPESPKYLYTIGRYVDAKMVLIWLRGDTLDVNTEFEKFSREQSDYESDSVVQAIENKNPETKRALVKAVFLSMTLATIQRMSGAGAIVQYTSKLFQISGSSVDPISAEIITGVFQLIGSAVTVVYIDKVGRRKLLLISSSVVVICLSALTLYFYFLNNGMLGGSFRILPIVVACTFISFFRLGLGPIPWFMTSELIGSDHGNRCQSYVASYSWILSIVVMQTFIPFINQWPVALWFGYSALSFAGFLFILFFIPETNNKSSEEIRTALSRTFQLTSR